jgi:predicted nucleic acid-binding protein
LTLYLDTSLIVSALTIEPGSKQSQAWFGEQDPQQFLISEWTATEVSSALGIKLRTGQLTVVERAAALALFHQLTAASFTVASVVGTHFRMAAGYLDRYELGLRASDALHLAVAADEGAQICTLDRRMAAAGPALGVPTILVSSVGVT